MSTENPEVSTGNPAQENRENILYIGLDLGTSQSAMATSTGIHINCASVVGWPKDLISYKLHQKSILFGDECLRNRMSVDMYYPFEKGVITQVTGKDKKSEDAERKNKAPFEFIRHMISLAEPKKDQQVYIVVGAPAEATVNEKQQIIDAVGDLVDSVLVVSQPFLVSYGLGVYGFAMIVDIGAGTLDICRMHGTIPNDTDQRTTFKAGSYIDEMLFDILKAKYPNGQVTEIMARQFKEQYAFVGNTNEQISVEILLDNKPTRCDISNELKESCESILEDITSNLRSLIVSFDPEFQESLRNNILLAGCMSQMRGLSQTIEQTLSDLGSTKVISAQDPLYASAVGALKLGQDMPVSEWQQL